jgi:predicted ATPase/DNA-binding SARP family transcriptional activator
VPPTAPPLSLTSFIGREEEVTAIRALLKGTRLLTLTGAGGSGKTRLASEVATLAASDHAAGAIWVELAPLQQPELVPAAVLAALEVEQGTRTAIVALLDSLRERDLLLVLDNCEHLVDACAGLTETLLQSCPRLRILATSREALGVRGERAWLVPGLSLPGADARSATAIEESDAVRLFVERAQEAVATFQLTNENAPSIVRICRRLDGLPLAIELAAARVRSLPPEQLAARLDTSFGVLAGGPRTAVPRHRTLREAIQWSYDLLDAPERTLLERLSVFAGDFTLEAAERVCASAEMRAEVILDLLSSLVDKSLVVMREEGGSARYYLLETIRQFARELLHGAGEEQTVFSLHAQAYAELVAEAEPHLITRERPHWVARVYRELDNIRVALTYTREHDPSLHVRIAGMLRWFWYSTGLWSEGRRWLESAITLSAGGAPSADRAKTLLGAGVLGSLQADLDVAIPWLEESAAISAAVGDEQTHAYAQAYMGVAYGQTGDTRTEAPSREALSWFRSAGDLYGLRLCLIVLSTYHVVHRDLSLALAEAEEGAQVAREYGLHRELAIALQILAAVVLANTDLQRAADILRESLAALRRDPSLFWIARGLQLLGVVTCQMGDTLRGARLLGAAEASREIIGAGLLKYDARRLAPVVETARQTAGAEAFDHAWYEGRQLSTDDAMAMVLDDGTTAPDARIQSGAAAPEPVESPATLALEVRALGHLEILVDGQLLRPEAWRFARPRELLLYLLSHPEGRTRDQIGLTFWPESSTTQVKNSFHVALHHLRRALGRADLIAYVGDRYRMAWELGVSFDARDFEARVSEALKTLRVSRRRGSEAPPLAVTSNPVAETALADLRDALSLYRGDFLEDAGVGDWHLDQRDRLRRLFVEGMLLVAAGLRSAGSYEEAADACRRVIAVEELDEDAHRQLMENLTRAGDRASALRHYERLAQRLKADLDARPEAETAALFERIRRGDAL